MEPTRMGGNDPRKMDPRIRRALGFMLRVVGGTACGTAVGAIAGLLLTSVNNLVLARRFGAAEGSYVPWALFLGTLLLVPSAIASIAWAVVFLHKPFDCRPPAMSSRRPAARKSWGRRASHP
jgi:hypothetical protein